MLQHEGKVHFPPIQVIVFLCVSSWWRLKARRLTLLGYVSSLECAYHYIPWRCLAVNSQTEAFPWFFPCGHHLDGQNCATVGSWYGFENTISGMLQKPPLVQGFWPLSVLLLCTSETLFFVQREVCKSTRRWRLRWQVVMWSHDVARHAAKHRTREGWCLGLSWCRCAGLLESESC